MVLTTLGVLPFIIGAIFLYAGNLEREVEKGKPRFFYKWAIVFFVIASICFSVSIIFKI